MQSVQLKAPAKVNFRLDVVAPQYHLQSAEYIGCHAGCLPRGLRLRGSGRSAPNAADLGKPGSAVTHRG